MRMKTRFLIPLFLLLATPAFTQASDEALIREKIAAFSEALMSRDIGSVVDAYTEDASIFPNGTDILKGREAIRRYWTLPPGDTTKYHKILPEEITIADDTAYDYGYYEIGGVRQGKPYEKVRGKYVIVWKKKANGWKMYLDIWNRAATL